MHIYIYCTIPFWIIEKFSLLATRTTVCKDSAANLVRFAKAVEKDAPYLLPGMHKLSVINLPQAEQKLHDAIAEWGMAAPIPIYFWHRGLNWAPMLRVADWFDFLLSRHPQILLGGFSLDDRAVTPFLHAFWAAYKYKEPSQAVFSTHADTLGTCVPICVYSDEGRGLRKAPVLVVALEALFSLDCCKMFQGQKKKAWTAELMWSIQGHTGSGSSLLSRLLLYVLPHKNYKGKRNPLYYRVFDQVATDLATAFTTGIPVSGKRWHLVLVGVKGDAPALAKMGRFTRTHQHLGGPGGICFSALLGSKMCHGKTSRTRPHGMLPSGSNAPGKMLLPLACGRCRTRTRLLNACSRMIASIW